MAKFPASDGVRRINHIPLLAFFAAAAIILVIFAFGVFQRDADQKVKDQKLEREQAAANQGADPGAILKMAPKAVIIEQKSPEPPPGETLPQTPSVPAVPTGAVPSVPTQPSTAGRATVQSANVPTQAELQNQEAWELYRQAKQQMARADELEAEAAREAPMRVDLSHGDQGKKASAGGTALGGMRAGAAGSGSGAVASGFSASGVGGDDPNRQSAKQAFFEKNFQETNLLPATREALTSPYELRAGTLLPGALITGINSDLPGEILGQVRTDVYDTATGRYLLIPSGAKLFGRYDSGVTYGQQRVLVAWNRVIFPDGSALDLQGMSGTDPAGAGGFSDLVDNHYLRTFGGAILMSLFSSGAQLSQPQATNGQNVTAGQTVASAMGQQLSVAGSAVVQKNLGIPPTLEIRPGYRFDVMVRKDIVFPGPYAKPRAQLAQSARQTVAPIAAVRQAAMDVQLANEPRPPRLVGPQLADWHVVGASEDGVYVTGPHTGTPRLIGVGDVLPDAGRVRAITRIEETEDWVVQLDHGYIIGVGAP